MRVAVNDLTEQHRDEHEEAAGHPAASCFSEHVDVLRGLAAPPPDDVMGGVDEALPDVPADVGLRHEPLARLHDLGALGDEVRPRRVMEIEMLLVAEQALAFREERHAGEVVLAHRLQDPVMLVPKQRSEELAIDGPVIDDQNCYSHGRILAHVRAQIHTADRTAWAVTRTAVGS